MNGAALFVRKPHPFHAIQWQKAVPHDAIQELPAGFDPRDYEDSRTIARCKTYSGDVYITEGDWMIYDRLGRIVDVMADYKFKHLYTTANDAVLQIQGASDAAQETQQEGRA